MSATLKTLTGAALAAAITLGGFTSAHAQFSNDQTYNVPFLDEPVLEDVVTDDEPMIANSDHSRWYTEGHHRLTDQHYNWLGVDTEDGVHFSKAFKWQGVDNLYHKSGKIFSGGTNTYFDNLWVTTDTLFAERSDSPTSTVVIENFILQVGTTTVHGKAFGNQTADKPLDLYNKCITYDGKTTSQWGVDNKGKDTQFIIENYGGVIHDVSVYGGCLDNIDGTIDNATLNYDGIINNEGFVEELWMWNGFLDNRHGYIETLYWTGKGTINGQANIGQIIHFDPKPIPVPPIGEAAVDNGDWQDAGFDNSYLDNAGWQDAAPLGEEVMVW